MDVFIRNVPLHVTEKQLERFFRPTLAELGIDTYSCFKVAGKTFAILTVLDTVSATIFLDVYGLAPDAPRAARPHQQLRLFGSNIKCTLSNREPSDFLIRHLVFEATKRAARKFAEHPDEPEPTAIPTTVEFKIHALRCGVWDYIASQLVFIPHYRYESGGSVFFGAKQAIVVLPDGYALRIRIDVDYYSIDLITTGSYGSPSLTFSLRNPPRFYIDQDEVDIAARLHQLGLNSSASTTNKPVRSRTMSIDTDHAKVVGTCFVYQLQLDPDAILDVCQLLHEHRKMPASVRCPTPIVSPKEAFAVSFARLQHELSDLNLHGHLPFSVKYQAQRLTQNGRLGPLKVIELLRPIARLHGLFGSDTTVQAIRHLYTHVPDAGPHTEASNFSIDLLIEELNNGAQAYEHYKVDLVYSLPKHTVLIHKIVVTPAGTYLEGPDAEVTNRVLRDYPDHIDHFARVTFVDEDNSSVRYDPRASQEDMFYKRFKQFLNGSFPIAGRSFSFLGFSHSSLRSQTCWYMSPFVQEHGLVHSRFVIERLGDFSQIRSPAKCAARIGQAFSETTGAVLIHKENLNVMPDVERHGRCFSDGVGTISLELLQQVWNIFGTELSLKPTLLQIRFAGAKGMVSLDPRLSGKMLKLRASMIKFYAPNHWNIEICGASFKPLPMVLNRQFIKILEDLGVQPQSFLDLQATAVERLRRATTSPLSAADFLEECKVTRAARMPGLIRLLDNVGLDFQHDLFLTAVVEMAVLAKLRDIKYRARIPVDGGVTLYGVMDETGFLQEGEIYVVTKKPTNEPGEFVKQVLTGGRVAVTRSPALHPGDIRLVKAVDVPESSPLSHLDNCVVFSQYGARDLPSQLSGGDLDGDLYNIIFDQRLMPQQYLIHPPADYTRVSAIDIGKEVNAKDMADFFLKFMETDHLGQISTIHMQVADQKDGGTVDSDCIKLAEMASTAVDYAKTGVPVSIPVYVL
ncbi:hypothetical protein LTR66_002926 [Elasticomyces elasticus]|nr:hypothetical protein LTR66_002926 [Elasticomyces elasticus]